MKTLVRNAIAFRVGLAFLVLFSINSLCTSTIGALSGMDWATANTQTKLIVCIAIVGNWTAVLLAFFRDAIAKIAKGEIPLPLPPPETRAPFPPPPPRLQPGPEAFEKFPPPSSP